MKRSLHRSHNRKRPRPRNHIRVGRRLMYIGWGLFAISIFLPAVLVDDPDEWYSGWHCACIVLRGLVDALRGHDIQGWYLNGFALANIVMLLSPMLVRSRKWSPMTRRFGWGLMLASAIYVSSLLHDNFVGTGIGFYTWIASFWLVFAGVLKLQSNPKAAPRVDDSSVPAPPTEQELAARRELESFLRS